MAHQVILLKNEKKQDISRMIGNLAWSSSVDALGEEMSFSSAYNDSQYLKGLDILEPGDQLALFNGRRFLNYYVIVKVTANGRFGKTFSCFDRAWYLNKNETVIQFKRIAASQALAKLLDKVGIKHSIVNIPTLITKIYKDEVISDIIADILDQAKQETGITYRYEMVKNVLTVQRQANMLIEPKVRLSVNTSEVPVTRTISNPTRELSIEELKNNVLVVADGEDSAKIYATASNPASIARYGQLTEVVTLDQKNAAQARNVAANALKELNKIVESVSWEMLGHDDVRAGRLIAAEESITGISGTYLIKSANHTEQNGIHRVSVELGAT